MSHLLNRLRTSQPKKVETVQEYHKYLVVPEKRPSALYRLFCFSCAGGNASTYNRKWFSDLPKSVEYVAVQLPGRQSRSDEPFITDMKQLISQIVDAMTPLISSTQKPYAFFGHSLGTVIAYETALEIRRRNLPLPLEMFLAGRAAPGTPDPIPRPLDCDLPDPEFVNACIEAFGPSNGLLDKELHSVTIPPLRADLKLYYSYTPDLSEPLLDIPFIVIGGSGDPLSQMSSLQTWKNFTSAGDSQSHSPSPSFSVPPTPSPIPSPPPSSTPFPLPSPPSSPVSTPLHSPHRISSPFAHKIHFSYDESFPSPSTTPSSLSTPSLRLSAPPFQAEIVDVVGHHFLNEDTFKHCLNKHLSHLCTDIMDEEIWC